MARGSRGVGGARALVVAVLTALLGALLTATGPAASGAVGFTADVIVLSPAPGQLRVAGWVFDNDVPTAPVSVHVYVGGAFGTPGVVGYDKGPAVLRRPDVGQAFPQAGPDHGYDWTWEVPLHGTRQVTVYGIDANGTTNEVLWSGIVAIANPVPETTITAAPPAAATVSTPTVTAAYAFTASEESTFECSWDDGPWQGCTSPTERPVGPGQHTFAVRAVDLEGATDPTPATHAFTVDAQLVLLARAVRKASRVRIDVGPDLEQSNYRLVVQRARGKAWRTVRRTQTLGARDRVVLDLPRGRYRIVVPPQQGMAGASATVRLRR